MVEQTVKESLAGLLADPQRVLDEVRHIQASQGPTVELNEVLLALQGVEARQRRLVRLFTDGGLPEDVLNEQRLTLSRERERLESRRQSLEPKPSPIIDLAGLSTRLPQVLAMITKWIEEANGDDFDLLLNAVDAQVTAEAGKLTISGALPLIESLPDPDLATTGRTSA